MPPLTFQVQLKRFGFSNNQTLINIIYFNMLAVFLYQKAAQWMLRGCLGIVVRTKAMRTKETA